jgi:hypothetical protein
MNERIRELAEQAKAESSQWLGSKPATTITYDELEKFAELIVRECIDVVGKATASPNGYQALMKHFGVEE